MRQFLLTVITLIVSGLFFGCAERNETINETNILKFESQIQTKGWAKGVWVHNDTAYVADDEMGITVIDVRNSSAPRIIRNFQTTGRTITTRVANLNPKDGYRLLLVLEVGGLRFYPLGKDSLVGSFGSSGMTDIEVLDLGQDTVLISTTDLGDGMGVLRTNYVYDAILNFQYWDDTQRLFHKPAFSSYRGVCMDGNYSYLAFSQVGVELLQLDYSAPGAFPVTKLGSLDTPGQAYDIALNSRKDHLAVADFQFGIQLIDITDRTNPRLVGSINPPGADRTIKVETLDDVAYFIDQYTSLYAADISVPFNPTLVGQFKAPQPTDLYVEKKAGRTRLFLTDQDLGLVIFTVSR